MNKKIDGSLYNRVMDRDKWKCIECGESDRDKLTIDHKIPKIIIIMNEEKIYDGLTKNEIINLPTLHSGDFDDLKREDFAQGANYKISHVKVWVSRIETTPDNLPQITIEKLIGGIWETTGIY